MTNKPVVGLTSTEISSLWSTYLSNSLAICLSKHFLAYIEDEEAKPLILQTLNVSQLNIAEIKSLFTNEKFPIPRGFTDEDVDLNAPALFFDLFPLSYEYAMSRLNLLNYGLCVSNAARTDVRVFFSKCLNSTVEMFNKSTDLMLSKGIYDRPAFIPYPDQIEFIKKKGSFLSEWIEPHRPLNVLELTEIFFNIERNYFGVILLTAFIQVVKDDKIKQFLVRGKALANKQIEFLNKQLKDDDLLGTIMVNTEVSTSTISPFSDRLILGLITMSNSAAITYIGRAISTASRIDLTAGYSKLLLEIMQYGKEGVDLMIEREWLEVPPHAANRKALAKL